MKIVKDKAWTPVTDKKIEEDCMKMRELAVYPMPVVLQNDDGIRRDKTKCTYCDRLIGEEHRRDCVAIHKKVLVRAVVEYEIEVPFSWGKDIVESYRNEGSWCCDNIIDELQLLSTDEEGCLCNKVKFEFITTTVPGPYGKEAPVSATVVDTNSSN